jgi:anti-sigma-K factor RskA
MPDLTCDEVREMAGAFVLGALLQPEEDAVRAHLATCSDAHAEIAELGGVLPVLDASVPVVEPPAGLRARIMAAAAADLEARAGAPGVPAVGAPAVPAAPTSAAPPVTAAAAGSTVPTPFPSADERTARRSGASAGSWVLRIAAVLAIVLLGGWNLLLQSQVNPANAYEQSVAAVLDVAAQPGSHTAILTAAGASGGSGLAAISASGAVSIAMQDLAATSGKTVYTAWAIGGDGVPIALGDFTVGNNGTGSLAATGAPTAAGVVVALTLEPGPGATTPTLPIISKGVATAAG